MTTNRALLLALDFPPERGGISRLLAEWIGPTGACEWRVLTTTAGRDDGMTTRAPLRQWPRLLWRLRRWPQSSGSYVVVGHVHLLWFGYLFSLFTRSSLACIVYGCELDDDRRVYQFALWPLRRCDRVIAISRFTAERARAVGARADRIRIVTPKIASPWKPIRPRGRNDRDPLRLVIISRLAERYKNVDLAIDLAASLGPSGVIGNVAIVGSGPRAQELAQYARLTGASPYVTFTGHIPDDEVLDVVAAADVGLFPSTYTSPLTGYEGFGLTIHEMGTAGLPVVAGAVAGALDAIEPPWTIGVDPTDLAAWESVITELWQYEERRFTLALSAHDWAVGRSFTGRIDVARALWEGIDR